MKKLLLFGLFCSLTTLLTAQCNPMDYDFGDEQFGVSPDPQQGETFEIGTLGIPYADIIYILVPTEAGDVDSTFEGFGTIDSLRLDAVNILINDVPQNISTIGLDFTCNNNGDLPDPCSFLGGQQYCADLTGTPTMAGTFPLEIAVTGYVSSFIGQVEVPYTFSDFTITILDPNAIEEHARLELTAFQNSPNPVSGSTDIRFEINKSAEALFVVSNLLGERISNKKVMAKRGMNTISFDASELKAGVYLYSITVGDKKITRRMIVQ